MTTLTWGPLNVLVDALRAADVRADLDPSSLNLPAAWVTVEGIQAANVAGDTTLLAVVYLIVPDQDYGRALADLADLYNLVVPGVLRPDGQVVPQGVILPDSTTPLPALRVPVNLYESE